MRSIRGRTSTRWAVSSMRCSPDVFPIRLSGIWQTCSNTSPRRRPYREPAVEHTSGVTERSTKRSGRCVPIDDEVQTIILKSLSKSGARYQTAGELCAISDTIWPANHRGQAGQYLVLVRKTVAQNKRPVGIVSSSCVDCGVCNYPFGHVGSRAAGANPIRSGEGERNSDPTWPRAITAWPNRSAGPHVRTFLSDDITRYVGSPSFTERIIGHASPWVVRLPSGRRLTADLSGPMASGSSWPPFAGPIRLPSNADQISNGSRQRP